MARLLADLGEACEDYADRTIRGVRSQAIQLDEIWSFCYAKQKNVPAEKKGIYGYGDVWTWVALDADTKLVLSWLVGRRDAQHAEHFVSDVASRVEGSPQITTDGLQLYRWAVAGAFGRGIDYAQVQKIYGATEIETGRYSPPVCIGCNKVIVSGAPDEKKISTSYVERNMLTMRMGMRRMTRLTNAFSKKVENLEAAVSLHFFHYNFCRKHQTLGTTPAMAAGMADHVWKLDELVALLAD